MALETFPYDSADFLTSDETIAEYLVAAFESEDPRIISKALSTVARARGGIGQLARETDIEFQTLAQALDGKGNPDLGTVIKVMQAFGVRLSASLVA